MRPDVKAFFDPATSTVSYLVWDAKTKAAAIIDPVLDFDPAAARLSRPPAGAESRPACSASAPMPTTWSRR